MNKFLHSVLFLILSTIYSNSIALAETADVNCGLSEVKNILSKIYDCPNGFPDLDELFKKEKIRARLNYTCYLCMHKEVSSSLKTEKNALCQRMYVENIEDNPEIDLVMRTSRCNKISDATEKIKQAESKTFSGCLFVSSKVLKLGYDKSKSFLCVGHVYCPANREGVDPKAFLQEAYCMVEPKYMGEDDNAIHADNLKCPSVEKCAFDLVSIRSVDEIQNSWSSGPIHEQYADYIQSFTPSFPTIN